MLKPARNYRY